MKAIAIALVAIAACSSPPAPEPAEAPAAVDPAPPEPAAEPVEPTRPAESPEAVDVGSPDPEIVDGDLVVSVNGTGEITIDGATIAEADLVAAFASHPPETRVVIKADPAASHARVVAVIQAAKDGGLSKIAISVGKKAD